MTKCNQFLSLKYGGIIILRDFFHFLSLALQYVECKNELHVSLIILFLFFFFFKLYKLNIHNVVAEFVPLIMNTIIIQVSAQAR